jgi:hypothetical protein
MSTPSPHHAAMTAPSAPPATPDGYVELAPGSRVKFRSPLVVVILSIVTLGIYTIVWWYRINEELADHGRSRGTRELGEEPMLSTLALFPGGLVVVPAIWTMVTTFQRVQAAQRLNGQVPINGWIGLLLALVFSPALYAYLQSGLNSAWSAAQSAAPPRS